MIRYFMLIIGGVMLYYYDKTGDFKSIVITASVVLISMACSKIEVINTLKDINKEFRKVKK